MKLLEPFELFSQQECARLIDAVSTVIPAGVWGAGRKESVRNNSVYWYELPKDLKDRLWQAGQHFSEQYPWTWFQEPVQISSYGPGEFYNWHDDVIGGRSSRRCLTLTCTLMPAPGAVFETENQVFDLAAGQAVFFPSTLVHRARAPLEGTRWAFTVWYMQPNH